MWEHRWHRLIVSWGVKVLDCCFTLIQLEHLSITILARLIQWFRWIVIIMLFGTLNVQWCECVSWRWKNIVNGSHRAILQSLTTFNLLIKTTGPKVTSTLDKFGSWTRSLSLCVSVCWTFHSIVKLSKKNPATHVILCVPQIRSKNNSAYTWGKNTCTSCLVMQMQTFCK